MSACCFTLSAMDPASAIFSALRVVVSVNCAALHDELHVLECRDIFSRVAVDGDQVGELAWFERTDGKLWPEQVRSIDGSSLNGGERRHAELYVNVKLAGVQAVRIDSGVSSKRNLHAGVERFLNILLHGSGNIAHLLLGILGDVALI